VQERNVRNVSSWVAACSLLSLLCHDIAWSQASRLPDFGSPADSVLSKNREQQLGRSVILQLRNAGVIMDDPLLTEYVGVLGARLASQANDGDYTFNFFMVEDNRINAFAMPGGYIGVHSGLLLASETESELAGVLAHEVSHVTQRHIARSIYDNQRNSVLSMATMLAAILLGATTDVGGNAMQGIITAGQAAAIQRQINFTRGNEHEADRIGMEVLSRAGFDPSGMASFFEKLARRYGVVSQYVPEMLQTHPVTSERIAEARDRARQLPKQENVNSIGYGLAKARIEVLTANTPEAALAIFDNKLDPNSAANRYGRALTLTRLGRNDEAERSFRELIGENSGIIAYRIGRAEALMSSGQTQFAMDTYQEATRLFPRNVPLTISYAEALIASDRASEAHERLLDLLNNVPPTPAQIQLIARAANAEGDVGNAMYYMAEYYISIGNLPLAVNQIRMAMESPDVNSIDQARFRAKLERWTESLSDEDRERLARATGRPTEPHP
jgi:predicted Zn-dependent protease